MYASDHPPGPQTQLQDEGAVPQWRVSLDLTRLQITSEWCLTDGSMELTVSPWQPLTLCFPAGHRGVPRQQGSHGASARSHRGPVGAAHPRDHPGRHQAQPDGEGGEGGHSCQVPG